MKTVTVDQMRELDKRAVSEYGIPSLLLMEQAGKGVAEAIFLLLRHQPKSTTVTVLAGNGNNAGDGFVAARYLHQKGVPVVIYLLGIPKKFKGDAAVNYNITQNLRITTKRFDRFENDLTAVYSGVPLVILDAMLGTGFHGAPRSPVSGAIALINRIKTLHSAKNFVMAVDIPSGLDGDNGPAGSEAVRADFTVTFGYPKTGLLRPDSRPFTGKVHVVDIGIPHVLFEALVEKKA